MYKHIAPIGVALLLLTGCSSAPESAPAETSKESAVPQTPAATTHPEASDASPLPAETQAEEAAVTGPGVYSFTADTGATGSISVPGEVPADIEELRQLVDGPSTTFITADVDNRKGSDTFIFYELWVYDPEGVEHTYTDVSEYISELRALLPEDAPSETYNRFIDAENELSGDSTEPLQSRTIMLTGDPVPTEITGVRISTGYDQLPTVFEG